MLALIDGRNKLAQWDTARKAEVTAECDRVHLANMEWGTAFVVDVVGGEIDIPDELLQSGAPLYAWAWVGSAEDGYTKQSGKIEVERRPKPNDYVFTATEQESLKKLREQLGDLDNLDTEARQNLVAAINEVLSKFVETVGIEKIEQTTTSDEVGGINVITVTLTDESKYEFAVRNGDNGMAAHLLTLEADKWTDDSDTYIANKPMRVGYRKASVNEAPNYIHGESNPIKLTYNWQEFESTFTLDTDAPMFSIFFKGGVVASYIQPYDISDVRLYSVSDMGTNLMGDDHEEQKWRSRNPNTVVSILISDGIKYTHVFRQHINHVEIANQNYINLKAGTYVLQYNARISPWLYSYVAPVPEAHSEYSLLVSPTDSTADIYADYGMRCVAFGNQTVIFAADSIPNVDVQANVMVTRPLGAQGLIFDGIGNGKDGATPTIGSNGNWYINGVDTGKPSRGQNGSSVTIRSVTTSLEDGGANVVSFSDGKELVVRNGNKGTTPHIGENGNWWIGDTDTGVAAGGTGDGGGSSGGGMELLWENADELGNVYEIKLANQNYSKLLIVMTTPYYYDYPYLYTTSIFVDTGIDKALPDQDSNEYNFNKVYPCYVCGIDTIGNYGYVTQAVRNISIGTRDLATGNIKSIYFEAAFSDIGSGWSGDSSVMIPVRVYGIA